MTVGQATITSDNAVLSAYSLSIRAPVSGTFAGEGLRVGDLVAKGAVLGRLHDDRADTRTLMDLAAEADRADAERLALAQQRTGLSNLRTQLQRRADDFRHAAQAYGVESAEAARQTLLVRRAQRAKVGRDLIRMLSLTRAGVAPSVDLEHLRGDLAVADGEVAVAAANVARLVIQQSAVEGGFLLDNGSNDASYSAQRIDDIALRLTEIDRAIASFGAAASGARTRLASEHKRLAQLQDAVLTAPSDGMVWRVGASDGERLAVGDTAVELVDCRAGFILAAIPQDRFGDVEIGGIAHFRMSGEQGDRTGRILGVTGASDLALDRNLAAAPSPGRGATVLARVGMPVEEGACAVGRTARVLLQANEGSSLFARLMRRITG